MKFTWKVLPPIAPIFDDTEWHKVFVWFPMIIDNDDVRALIFWEDVERRRNILRFADEWEYRLI